MEGMFWFLGGIVSGTIVSAAAMVMAARLLARSRNKWQERHRVALQRHDRLMELRAADKAANHSDSGTLVAG